jgi:hypothetical protein
MASHMAPKRWVQKAHLNYSTEGRPNAVYNEYYPVSALGTRPAPEEGASALIHGACFSLSLGADSAFAALHS